MSSETPMVPAVELSEDSSDIDSNITRRSSWARKMGVGGVAFLVAVGLVSVVSHFRSPSVPVGARADPSTLLEAAAVEYKPPPEQCSKSGEECGMTKCCKLSGYKCYNKDAKFNGCVKECPYMGATPKGEFGKWSCERPMSLIPTTPGIGAEPSISGPSLFCYEAFLTDPGHPTHDMHELEIVRTQLMTHTSIFGCDEWRVFSDAKVEISPGNPGPALYSIPVAAPHIGLRKKEGTWINTPFFQNIWASIKSEGKYLDHQYTIKVDVDAVFFPQRLTARLATQEVTSGGIYIVNCEFVKDGFFGPLEVMSKQAMTTFLANFETCDTEMDWKTSDKQPWGEDKFLEKCMEKHGVTAIEDYSLISDAVCDNIADKAKMAKQQGVKYDEVKLPIKVQKCTNTSSIAFHPFRRPFDYFECVKNAQR